VPAPRRGAPLFGFNDDSVRAEQLSATDDAIIAALAGADVERVTFDWRWVEPQPGQLRLGYYDDIYRELRGRGIRPLLVLMYAPWWAWEPGTGCNQWAEDCRYPPGREHYSDLRRIAALVAGRYPEAAGIEIWNEPNSPVFWQGRPDAARYAELLGQAHDAVKRANPSMRVISGGLTGARTTGRGEIAMGEFLAGMYRHGARGSMDAIGVHAYPWNLDLGEGGVLSTTLSIARAARDAASDRGRPLWVTETGLSTATLSEADQARGLAGTYRALAAMPDVDAVVVHTLLPLPGSAGKEAGYGVIRSNLTPRPAFCALATERGMGAICG
jgi:hypothetical protein